MSVAGWGDLARVDMGLSMAKEIDIRFTMTYEPEIDFPATLTMLASGAFDAGALISDHIPLERLIDDGLEELLESSRPGGRRLPRRRRPRRRSPARGGRRSRARA